MIPFIDLKAQQDRIKEDLNRRIQKVLDHGQYIMGPEVKELDARGVNNELKHTSFEQWQTKVSALPEQFRAACSSIRYD